MKTLVAFAAVYFIWGSTYLAIAWAVDTIPPFLTIGTRFFVAGTLLYVFLRLKGLPAPSRTHAKNASIIGTLTLGIATGLVAWAEQYIDSGFAALIITVVPLWLVLLDWKMLKGGAPSKQVIIGLVLGFIGIAVLVGPDVISGATSSNGLAVILVIVATMFWSFGSLRSKMVEMPSNLFMSSAVQMAVGGAVVSLLGIALGELNGFDLSGITSLSAWSWAYLVVFGSFGAFTAYVWLLAHAPPKQLASYAFVNPVVAIFLGWWLADELINARILTAAAIMVTAVAMLVVYGGKPDSGSENAEK